MTQKYHPKARPKRSFVNRTIDNMPLSVAAWLYNVRRAAKLLLPNNPFPLADQANSLSCQPLLFVSSGRAGTTLLRSMRQAAKLPSHQKPL